MTTLSIWIFIHIMLFVCSFGPDFGVYLASIYAKNAKLGFEARASLLKLANPIDLFPRISFALFLPAGIHLTAAYVAEAPAGSDLAQAYGVGNMPFAYMASAWLVALAWIVLIIVMFRSEGKPVMKTLVWFQATFQLVLGAIFVFTAVEWLVAGAPPDLGWFAVKLLLFGLMYWASFVLEFAYRPLIIPFLEIGQSGSTPEREARFTKGINNALIGVFILYLLVICIAFLGAVKPF